MTMCAGVGGDSGLEGLGEQINVDKNLGTQVEIASRQS